MDGEIGFSPPSGLLCGDRELRPAAYDRATEIGFALYLPSACSHLLNPPSAVNGKLLGFVDFRRTPFDAMMGNRDNSVARTPTKRQIDR
jgi:hypothetical protein